MKAKPYKFQDGSYTECIPSEASHVMINKRGPFTNQLLPVIQKGSRDAQPSPVWSWNGDTEKPTLKPSVLTWTDTDRCHTWITDGKVIYLPDCSHEFAGQTLELLEVDN